VFCRNAKPRLTASTLSQGVGMSMSPSRLETLDWSNLEHQLDQHGCVIIRSPLGRKV
jgi:hypothetical protein